MNLTAVGYDRAREEAFMKYWANNTAETYYCGFECMKERYSFMLGNCTDFTGFPGSGKSEFALEIMFYLSETYGFRHGLYVPDIGNYKEIRRKLIHKYTGKSFNSTYKNYISEQEIIKANAWVDHHFIILHKKDAKMGVSPVEFWEFICTYKDEGGVLHTGLIDSWKNLFHTIAGSREDLYLDYALSFRNELAEENNRHFFTIAHASKTDYIPGEKKRRIPDANDIKGGGSWFSSGRAIITVDFPNKRDNLTDLYFSKVKPDSLGKMGAVIDKLRFDWGKSRYYEFDPRSDRRYFAGDLAKAGGLPDVFGMPVHEDTGRADENDEAPWWVEQ